MQPDVAPISPKSSDGPYKVLFQDRGLFEETVRLIAPRLAAELDFDTTASLDKEYLTALARTRLQDKMRRVEFKNGALANGQRPYVLVLVEFQSGHDGNMAWRMRDYLHLAESVLREAGAVEVEGATPDMLSVVVHNGERPWRATEECAAPLTGDGPPARVRMYATVDLQVLARGDDAAGRALVPGSRLATLAALESAAAGRLPRLLLDAFERYGNADSAGFRRGLHLRVEAVLARYGIAKGLPTLAECERRLAERRGENMTAMLEATLARWRDEGVAEGVERGLAQGVERGLAQGKLDLLGRMAERRFGADVADQLTATLADVVDLSQLDQVGEWLVDCDTGAALLSRLRAGATATRD